MRECDRPTRQCHRRTGSLQLMASKFLQDAHTLLPHTSDTPPCVFFPTRPTPVSTPATLSRLHSCRRFYPTVPRPACLTPISKGPIPKGRRPSSPTMPSHMSRSVSSGFLYPFLFLSSPDIPIWCLDFLWGHHHRHHFSLRTPCPLRPSSQDASPFPPPRRRLPHPSSPTPPSLPIGSCGGRPAISRAPRCPRASVSPTSLDHGLTSWSQ